MTARTRSIRKTAKPRIGKYLFIGLLGFLLAFAVTLFTAGVSLAHSWLEDLPDYTDADAYLLAEPTTVLDADGNLIAEFYLENRIPITIDQVSPYVLQATVDTEDERYYQHEGVDTFGIMRAVAVTVMGGTEGASTITQQLVRNTVLKDEQWERTFSRKLREAYISIQIEKLYTKEEILMMYLNTINYGAGCYGIESASETYFGKRASELTLVEAATLAGLPQSPTSYDPTRNPSAALERRNLVLGRMLTNGDITQEVYDESIATPLEIHYTPRASSGAYAYPYFVDYVVAKLSNLFSEDVIFKGGLTVKTTLVPATQAKAEEAVNSVIGLADDGLEAALVCIDPHTGYVLAMVGGRSYETDQFNLATAARRQPGSSFKTFTLAAAIQAGVNPTVMIDCAPTIEIGDWTVSNRAQANYGIRSLESATWVSANTGYAQVAAEITPGAVIATAHAMGITSNLDEVISIALGTSGCSVLEMCSAYGTLANNGVHMDATVISEVDDRNGNIIYSASTTGNQAITPEVAYAVTQVLEGVITNGTGTAAELTVNQPVAGKTGTTERNRDLWFCGYTPQLSCAVWVGYRTDSTIYYLGQQGETYLLPNPIFSRFMSSALEGLPREEFPTASSPVYYGNDVWGFSRDAEWYAYQQQLAAQQAAEVAEYEQAMLAQGLDPTTGEPLSADQTTTDPSTASGDATQYQQSGDASQDYSEYFGDEYYDVTGPSEYY